MQNLEIENEEKLNMQNFEIKNEEKLAMQNFVLSLILYFLCLK